LTRRDGEVIVETIFDSVISALQGGDKIEIRGFGSFRIRQRNPRIGRNPKTGERVEVPPSGFPISSRLKNFGLGKPEEAEKYRKRRPILALGWVHAEIAQDMGPLFNGCGCRSRLTCALSGHPSRGGKEQPAGNCAASDKLDRARLETGAINWRRLPQPDPDASLAHGECPARAG